MCLFFFSSRRRHTRWTGDWSSDVCSSDLIGTGSKSSSLIASRLMSLLYGVGAALTLDEFAIWLNLQEGVYWTRRDQIGRASCRERCRSRGSPYEVERHGKLQR